MSMCECEAIEIRIARIIDFSGPYLVKDSGLTDDR
jgi:hypothetical protein